jgi:hypothetical protein
MYIIVKSYEATRPVPTTSTVCYMLSCMRLSLCLLSTLPFVRSLSQPAKAANFPRSSLSQRRLVSSNANAAMPTKRKAASKEDASTDKQPDLASPDWFDARRVRCMTDTITKPKSAGSCVVYWMSRYLAIYYLLQLKKCCLMIERSVNVHHLHKKPHSKDLQLLFSACTIAATINSHNGGCCVVFCTTSLYTAEISAVKTTGQCCTHAG